MKYGKYDVKRCAPRFKALRSPCALGSVSVVSLTALAFKVFISSSSSCHKEVELPKKRC